MYGDNEYLESQVMTASPYHLHLMVIDGAIRHAARAEQALDAGDAEAAHFALNHSRGFIGELISGIDAEQAPALAGALKDLFVFVFRNLVEADLQRDAGKVRDALGILHKHRETWLALAAELERAQSTALPAPGPPRPHILNAAAQHEPRHSWTT